MAAPKNRYDRTHLSDISAYQRMVTEIFAEASGIAGRLGDRARDGFDPDRPFSFNDYPALRERADRLIRSVSSSVTATVMSGIGHEWALANAKNDALVRQVFGEDIEKRMTDALRERYFGANGDALRAFGDRRVAGMNLSQRIWKRTEPFRTEMEDAIDAGLRDGLSAAEISRVVRQYLNRPDMRFRRVRDDHGDLVLSRRAAAYNPGAGVYRSSYKNAIRLTGTEVNMAYRTADHERWKDMDMVVGIEIHLSNNHTLNGKPFTDICDDLAGQYPKSFRFTGWHPQCRCYATTILKTEEELAEDNRRILNGEEPTSAESSENYVKDVPKEFSDWVKANQERIDAAASGKGSLPYFIKDNRAIVDYVLNPSANEGKYASPNQKEKSFGSDNQVNMSGIGSLDEMSDVMERAGVKYVEVDSLSKPLTDAQIISKLGALTGKNNCVSMALAYAGNKCGYDVLDSRGGMSTAQFSRNVVLEKIASLVKGEVVSNWSDYDTAAELLKKVEVGKEYIFGVGMHTAIVRKVIVTTKTGKTRTETQYLELQESTLGNGFFKLNQEALKVRFKCYKSHTRYGCQYQLSGQLIDIHSLKGDNQFKRLLGYLNTKK